MNTGTKIALSVLGISVCIGGGVGLGLYLKKNKETKPNDGGGDNSEANKGDSKEPEKQTSVIGKTAYSDTGVNLRLSPKVDDGLHDNKLKEMAKGNLGVVVSEVKGETDGLTWYYIKLNEPIWDYLPYPTHEDYAYVRRVDGEGNQIVKLK